MQALFVVRMSQEKYDRKKKLYVCFVDSGCLIGCQGR